MRATMTWRRDRPRRPKWSRATPGNSSKSANKLIQDFGKTQDRVQYIDVATPMFYAQDKPPRDLFIEDGLHPTAKCYALWTSIIKPVLLRQFGPKKIVSRYATSPTRLGFGVENGMPSAR